MNNQDEAATAANGEDAITSQSGDLSSHCAVLQSECDRLRLRVHQLEAERDQYRAEACARARREFEKKALPSEEELRRLLDEQAGVPLEAFVGELERIAKGP